MGEYLSVIRVVLREIMNGGWGGGVYTFDLTYQLPCPFKLTTTIDIVENGKIPTFGLFTIFVFILIKLVPSSTL